VGWSQYSKTLCAYGQLSPLPQNPACRILSSQLYGNVSTVDLVRNADDGRPPDVRRSAGPPDEVRSSQRVTHLLHVRTGNAGVCELLGVSPASLLARMSKLHSRQTVRPETKLDPP
jgi:hypothetical protein